MTYGTDGGWLDLRSPDEITVLQRRTVKQNLVPSTVILSRLLAPGSEYMPTDDDVERLDRIQVSVMLALIAGWDRDEPVNRETIENLPGTVYDQMAEACATQGADLINSMHVDFDPTSMDPATVDPTGASRGSAKRASGGGKTSKTRNS